MLQLSRMIAMGVFNDVFKVGLTVHRWFVRQALTGSSVTARKPTEANGQRLSPKELGMLANQLVEASSPADVARVKESLTRGFYAN